MQREDCRIWVIIPAAGSGQRFGESLAKQYLYFHNKTMIEHSISPFLRNNAVSHIVVALSENDSTFKSLALAKHKKVQTVIGGATRAETVLNALTALKHKANIQDWILVHDAARPCLHDDDLNALINNLFNEEIGGILASPVSDTIKFVQHDVIAHTVSRVNLWQALTPQMFRYQVLLDALHICLHNKIEITDEASAIEHAGFYPKMIKAQHPNPKLTYPSDIKLIALLLQQNQPEEVVL